MDLLENLNNMITANEFAELNQYDLEYYDEGGYQGIEIDSFAKKLIEFAKLHVEKFAEIHNIKNIKYIEEIK